jgi:hypothetical protein
MWNESNIDMTQPIIRRAYEARKWAKVADIARLQAVWQHGGIYLDTDILVLKSLDALRRHECFYAFQEQSPSADWVCNCAFGAVPRHWFIRQALDGLYAMDNWTRRWIPERPTDFGPKHVTRLLRDAGLKRYSPEGVMVKDVYIAPVPMFFPFHHTETYTPECVTEQTLAVHFWEKSWQSSVPFPVRLAQRVWRAWQQMTTRSR